ncbi:MAG: hypothetical protein RL323_2246 [Pseudomonadota bacterium]|jgi:iron complex transport system substrate-binding protein
MKAGRFAELGWLMWMLIQPALAGAIRDDRGHWIELQHAPERIVSILPALTEMVCQLGKCDKLVGVDRYATWPAGVKQLPKVGGGLDPNIEAIVKLRPDVVLAAVSSRATERLKSLGMLVVSFEPQNHLDTRNTFTRLGALLEVKNADSMWLGIEKEMAEVARSLPASARAARVYMEVNDGPYGASESSFMGQTLSLLGAKNILPAQWGPFPKVNPEFVVKANPDVVMISQKYASTLAQRPGWLAMRAVREGKVCTFSEEEADILVRPGPRMPEAARLMARCLVEKF